MGCKEGETVYLRTEDQRLFRLPHNNGILFSNYTHLISLEEMCQSKKWMNQFCNLLIDLPDDLAEYKGFTSYKDKLIDYLVQQIEKQLLCKAGKRERLVTVRIPENCKKSAFNEESGIAESLAMIELLSLNKIAFTTAGVLSSRR